MTRKLSLSIIISRCFVYSSLWTFACIWKVDVTLCVGSGKAIIVLTSIALLTKDNASIFLKFFCIIATQSAMLHTASSMKRAKISVYWFRGSLAQGRPKVNNRPMSLLMLSLWSLKKLTDWYRYSRQAILKKSLVRHSSTWLWRWNRLGPINKKKIVITVGYFFHRHCLYFHNFIHLFKHTQHQNRFFSMWLQLLII